MTDKQRYEKIAMDAKGNLRDAWNRFANKWQDVEAYASNIKISDRQIQRGELKNTLFRNACEIIFVRRRPERAPGRPEVRRMLCTLSTNILRPVAPDRITAMNFHDPRTSRRLDEVKHNIVVVWDIIMQNYRNVSMETCYVRQTIPDDETFWKYYNEILFNLTQDQKANFMDSVLDITVH